jgi:hypothetical protein
MMLIFIATSSWRSNLANIKLMMRGNGNLVSQTDKIQNSDGGQPKYQELHKINELNYTNDTNIQY